MSPSAPKQELSVQRGNYSVHGIVSAEGSGVVNKPRLISLFCGPGGLDLGFAQAGFQTRLAVDKDSAAVETHRYNHREAGALELDLTATTPEDIIRLWEERSPDAAPVGVIGGPPCQSFSYANTNQSEGDVRHSLPTRYAEILTGLNARYGLDFFVFENVPGLKYLHSEKYLRFIEQFKSAGFRLFEGELEAWQFGVAQLRPRIFVVGINAAKHPSLSFDFPKPTCSKPRTVKEAIAGLPEPVFFSPQLDSDSFPVHPNHWTLNPKSRKFSDGTLAKSGKFGKSFAVLDWDKPSLTVAYGHREVHVHPSGTRRLSVFEAMLLQGFPRSYRLMGTLSDQIRLISEVVAPPVAYHLARAISRQLRYSSERAAN